MLARSHVALRVFRLVEWMVGGRRNGGGEFAGLMSSRAYRSRVRVLIARERGGEVDHRARGKVKVVGCKLKPRSHCHDDTIAMPSSRHHSQDTPSSTHAYATSTSRWRPLSSPREFPTRSSYRLFLLLISRRGNPQIHVTRPDTPVWQALHPAQRWESALEIERSESVQILVYPPRSIGRVAGIGL